MRPYLENIHHKKGLVEWLKGVGSEFKPYILQSLLPNVRIKYVHLLLEERNQIKIKVRKHSLEMLEVIKM
jgi:hypothetical protein